MASPSQNAHAYNNTRRHRTPRLFRAEQSGTATLVLTFDRPMDVQFDTFKVRTVDPANGIVDWATGGWTDERTLTATSGVVFSPTYSGAPFAVYLEGDLRGKARYPVPNQDRCERLEVGSGVDLDIDGGDPAGVQLEEDIDGGDPAGVQLEPMIDGGAP